MKTIVLCICGILCVGICFSQRIVNNIILFDIDDTYNEVDTVVLKNNLSAVNAYRCNKGEGGKDSCILYLQKSYDKFGRLTELIKGDDLTSNKVDYIVNCIFLRILTTHSDHIDHSFR